MAVPHYTYLVLKMPGPRGIITVKGRFELSDLCDKEFRKMAHNSDMTATYGQHKDKTGSATTGTTKQRKNIRRSQRQRNCEYNHQTQRKLQQRRRRPLQHRQQVYNKALGK
jgi:hypothetical protein